MIFIPTRNQVLKTYFGYGTFRFTKWVAMHIATNTNFPFNMETYLLPYFLATNTKRFRLE